MAIPNVELFFYMTQITTIFQLLKIISNAQFFYFQLIGPHTHILLHTHLHTQNGPLLYQFILFFYLL